MIVLAGSDPKNVREGTRRLLAGRAWRIGTVIAHQQLAADPALIADNDGIADRRWRGRNARHFDNVTLGHGCFLHAKIIVQARP